MPNLKLDKTWLLFLAVTAVFLAIKIATAHYSISDENTYYKMGELVAQGNVPYRDFFFGHFPLQIYIYALAFKIFGFNLLVLKLLSAAAIVISAAFVFATVKEKLNSLTATAAATIFFFSYGTMLFSNFPTGLEFALPFMAGALYFALRKKFLLSGLLLGLATISYQLSVLALPIFIAWTAMNGGRKSLIRAAIGFLAIAGGVSAIFLLIARGEFIRQVLIYHLQKPSEQVNKAAIFLRILKTNWPILVLATGALVSRYRNKAVALMSLGIALVYMLAFPIMKTAFNYYLLFAFPFLAILAGYGILSLHEQLTEKIKLRSQVAAAVVAMLIITTSFFAAKQFMGYDYQDFSQAVAVGDYVRANSLPGQTIFGDDSTVPLISLLSGREITLNYVDNNDMRYRSGITSLDTTLSQLRESAGKGELRFILLRKIRLDRNATLDFGIGTEEKFTQFLKDNCRLAKEFSADLHGAGQAFQVYDCRKM